MLFRAVKSGFHSMVEILLKATRWPQESLGGSVKRAMAMHRIDLVRLLCEHGATAGFLDFEDVCRTVHLPHMEEFLRAGADPEKDNAFARALNEIKARPLLRFYRSLKDEFPALHRQASLALAEAVKEKKARWVALLKWAGADPFMEVPGDLYQDWAFDEGCGRVAAEAACWSGDIGILKALNLKPTISQARRLLERAAFFPSLEVMKELLRHLPTDKLNDEERNSCPAVEELVGRSFFTWYSRFESEERDRQTLAALECLLDAGGRWNPEQDKIDGIRRTLLKHPSRYIVCIVRLLLFTPGAADPLLLVELCRTSSIRQKIMQCDKFLLKDLDSFAVQRP